MSDPWTSGDEITRLWRQLELYEEQGLFSHAMEICKNILSKEPSHERARSKMDELQMAKLEDSSTVVVGSPDDVLSPRLAMDLGLAYMGMNLYDRALEEFKRALKASPLVRSRVLPHIATCLVRLKQYQDGRETFARVLTESGLSMPEKGVIVGDALNMYDELDLADEALHLLTRIPDDQRKYVPNFDGFFERFSRDAEDQEDLEVYVEDDDTGKVYMTPKPATGASGDFPAGARQALVRKANDSVEVVPVEPPTPMANGAPGPAAARGAPADTAVPVVPVEAPPDAADADTARTVRFACICGKVHVVPRTSVGAIGQCSECGRQTEVPKVDTRRDRLTLQVIGKVVGGCRILHKIGGGGMGGVYKGHHIGLDKPVAVKILHGYLAEKDPVFIKRFIREARATAKLEHPNVVGVMNVGYENGLHYLVMPYVGGGSAQTLLDARGRLTADEVLDIAIQIARALEVAQENNIMHRDIKPANILFTNKGEAKLADLGLAKSYLDSGDAAITQTGIACGTPLYFSPEQAKGSPDLDIRSDIYSLGITMYHLLEGEPPFSAESAYVIFQKHVHDELPPFRKATPPVPEHVEKIVRKMTEKDPSDRFASAKELRQALEQAKEPSERKPDTPQKKSFLERLGLTKGS